MRLIRAFRYSLSGLTYAVSTQAAFRQDLILAVGGSVLALALDVTNLQRALLIGSLLMLLIVELLNTAIEVTIDRISTDQHPLSGHAKNLGSAAVFIALLFVALVWACVLLG